LAEFTSPPPETVAVLVNEGGAFGATSTVRVNAALAPLGNILGLEHFTVTTLQLQPPGPATRALAIRPDGILAATVTVPAVFTCPTLEIVIVYVSMP
jgi:hypothetical protein